MTPNVATQAIPKVQAYRKLFARVDSWCRSEECSAGETPGSFRGYATALDALVATGEPRAAERLANTYVCRLEQFAHAMNLLPEVE